MALNKFEAFPHCCRQILAALERDRRTGARNCENGHLVSIEYAEVVREQKPKTSLVSPLGH